MSKLWRSGPCHSSRRSVILSPQQYPTHWRTSKALMLKTWWTRAIPIRNPDFAHSTFPLRIVGPNYLVDRMGLEAIDNCLQNSQELPLNHSPL